MSVSAMSRWLHSARLGVGEHYRIIQANTLSRIGFRVIVVFLLVSLFAPWIAPHEPWEMLYDSEGKLASLRPPSLEFPLGTTHLGYDLFSQLVLAARTNLDRFLPVETNASVCSLGRRWRLWPLSANLCHCPVLRRPAEVPRKLRRPARRC